MTGTTLNQWRFAAWLLGMAVLALLILRGLALAHDQRKDGTAPNYGQAFKELQLEHEKLVADNKRLADTLRKLSNDHKALETQHTITKQNLTMLETKLGQQKTELISQLSNQQNNIEIRKYRAVPWRNPRTVVQFSRNVDRNRVFACLSGYHLKGHFWGRSPDADMFPMVVEVQGNRVTMQMATSGQGGHDESWVEYLIIAWLE